MNLPPGPSGVATLDMRSVRVLLNPASTTGFPTDFVNVKNAPYNAKGDGVTDDTAALQAAILAGGHVYMPPGKYIVTSTLNWPTNVTAPGIYTTLFGGGPGLVELDVPLGIGAVFNLGGVNLAGNNYSDWAQCFGFMVRHPAGNVADATFLIGTGQNPIVQNCFVVNAYKGVRLSKSSGSPTLRDLTIRCVATGVGVQIEYGGNLLLDNVQLGGTWPGVNPAPASIGIWIPPTSGLDTIRVQNSSAFGFYNNVKIDCGAAFNVIDLFFSDCIFDGSYVDCFVVNCTAGGGAGVGVLRAARCYLRSITGNGMTFSGTGGIQDCDFDDLYIPLAGGHGVRVANTAMGPNNPTEAQMVRFNNCRVNGSSQNGAQLANGFFADANSGGFLVRNSVASSGLAATGLGLNAGAQNVRAFNCDFSGNALAGIGGAGYGAIAAAATGPRGCLFRHIVGHTPYGVLVAPALPGAGVGLANPFPFDCTVFITSPGGGLTAIQVGGVTPRAIVANAVPAGQIIPVEVPAGGSLRYDGNPVAFWAWFAK